MNSSPQTKNQIYNIFFYIFLALVLRYFVAGRILEETEIWWLQIIAILIIFVVGIKTIFRGTTKVIEETTDVLKDRTGLAGGLLQAVGTAFPDMIIGVMAAMLSLQVRDTDYGRAINLAIIAAAATFGSNIYNIFFGLWCVYRQNLASKKHKSVLMFPHFKSGGILKPISEHKIKPSIKEMDNAIQVLSALTLLTAFVAISMVFFGRVTTGELPIEGDLYQLIWPIGIVLFALCIGVLYYFRKSHRPESPIEEIIMEEVYYSKQPTWRLWLDLVLSGLAILLAAQGMVRAIEVFSNLTHLPFVVTGIMAGLIGCLGEMIVVYSFSVNPKGRIGDAIVGVAMDNIITTLGASLVAIMGGIFLGGSSLIIIFITILAGNTLLIAEISKFKNSLSIAPPSRHSLEEGNPVSKGY